MWSVCFFTDFNEFLKQDVKVAPPVVVEEKVPEPVQQPKQELKQEPKQLPKVEDEVRWHSFALLLLNIYILLNVSWYFSPGQSGGSSVI